ncbi:MAG TPA: DUF4276 family protein [Tepidisphaeraceae bacterium]|jgi:hypothetical protein
MRLVLFVEGKGDKAAVPALARRVVKDVGANDALFVDPEPFLVKGIGKLVKNDCADWHRWLQAAGRTRRNLGAVLLVLDGDADQVPKSWNDYLTRYGNADFCPYRVAGTLAHASQQSRAGSAFSLAVVFAMKEFEAWLLAGVESLRGTSLAAGRGTVPQTAVKPDYDVENKRDAKGALRKLVPGYDQSLDQAVLTAELDLQAVAQRCRSFRRLQSAIIQLADAVRTGKAAISPIIRSA